MNNNWNPLEPDVSAALDACERPLDKLPAGEIPAGVIRNALPESDCQQLITRLIDNDLLFDHRKPVPAAFHEQAIPEGYYREGNNAQAKQAWMAKTVQGNLRIDVGSSLGYRGSDKEAFLEHSAETIQLFDRLFSDTVDPVKLIYDHLQALSVNKSAVTAYEPDGRRYGPAIFRAHYGGYTYKPHFDSVRLREKRDGYAVHEFEHQFAGVLVLQNAHRNGQTAQCRLHNYLWQEEVDVHLQQNTFHEFAADKGIDSTEVCLNPGDLYFFNTRCIHEVPGIDGELPRIVLATFIGFSSDRDEIFVWS